MLASSFVQQLLVLCLFLDNFLRHLLSVKAAQIDEEKSLIAKFGEGATKSGATLKGIFEKAIGSKKKKKEEK